MMKGSIEAVTRDSISGWIHVEGHALRDSVVLAFVDRECVGSGKISVFRQDLADAGLGDGFLGFHFRIRVGAASDLPRITVQLDGSDAIFVQHDARIGVQQPLGGKSATFYPGATLSAGTLQWMLARGWLTQTDHDFLKFFGRMGVYDRSLRLPRIAGETADPGRQDPVLAVRDQIALWAMREIDVGKRKVRPQDDIVAMVDTCMRENDILPIYAIWTAERGKLGVAEGSHNVRADSVKVGRLPFIDHPLGPDRALLIHAETAIRVSSALPQGGAVLFTARILA